MKAVKITESKFRDYVRVQQEGLYNMFDPRARQLTGLTTEEYRNIIGHYGQYAEKWPEVMKE